MPTPSDSGACQTACCDEPDTCHTDLVSSDAFALVCRCDAQAKMCIVIEQGFGSDAVDTVLVDLSTLRSADTSKARSAEMMHSS